MYFSIVTENLGLFDLGSGSRSQTTLKTYRPTIVGKKFSLLEKKLCLFQEFPSKKAKKITPFVKKLVPTIFNRVQKFKNGFLQYLHGFFNRKVLYIGNLVLFYLKGSESGS
jgi:hypothetical protein